MGWLAVDTLSDARTATQSLLLPVDRGRWLRLAVVALFVGGAGGLSSGGGGGGSNVSTSGSVGTLPDSVGSVVGDLPAAVPPRSVLLLVAGIVVSLLLIGVLWSVVGAVMEFVLVDGLRFRDVRIREPFGEHLGRGLRLFGFRLAIGLVLLVLVGLPVAAVVGGVVAGFGAGLLLLLVPLGLLFVVLAIVAGVVGRLTTDFVVPAMLVERGGVLAGWRRVWPVVRSEWRETLLYVVLRYVLSLVVGLGVGLVVALLALVVAIPFVVVGAVVWFASMPEVGLAGLAVLGVLGALFVLSVIALSAVVRVPVVTFFRYYGLFVLGGLETDLDLVGDLGTEDTATGEDGDERPDDDEAPTGGDGSTGDGTDGEETAGDADGEETERSPEDDPGAGDTDGGDDAVDR